MMHLNFLYYVLFLYLYTINIYKHSHLKAITDPNQETYKILNEYYMKKRNKKNCYAITINIHLYYYTNII